MNNPFVRKLRRATHLTDADEHVLASLTAVMAQAAASQDVVHEGNQPRTLTLILEGWACRYRILENGRRQIITFFLPGDLCEPFGILPRFMDHGIAALTNITYAKIRVEAVREAAKGSATIDQALWWDALNASALQGEQIVRLGRRQAVERMAHLFCELHARLEVVGLAHDGSFDLPVTQADLSDALGLSAVHVNRSLQHLRADGLIKVKGRRATIPNKQALWEFSDFDPAYLHLDEFKAG